MGVSGRFLLKISSPLTVVSGILFKPKGEEYKIIVNYNGQADLLLSLQIPPDYYPYQFKRPFLYDHITNIEDYLVVNDKTSSEKKILKEQLQTRINGLLSNVKEFGPGLWDSSMYNNGLEFRNSQFGNTKKTDLLFLEQFIIDEYRDISEIYESIPQHKHLIVTNHRASRDPYTVFSKQLFDCFKKETTDCTGDDKKIYDGMKKYLEEYNKTDVNSLYRTGKYIQFWNEFMGKNSSNDLKVEEGLKENKIFDFDNKKDKELSKKFLNLIFSDQETETLKQGNSNGKPHYLTKTHHPVLEQQQIPGDVPISEGTQKDMMIFMFQFAILIDEFIKGESFEKSFINDFRKDAMKNALNNAVKISKNFKNRINNIRKYFQDIGVVDGSFNPEENKFTNQNSKTFSIITFPPKAFGNGESLIHSVSKYSFIYHDIGLKQAIPNSISEHINEDKDHEHNEEEEKELFSLDDNGGGWSLGNFNLDPTKLLQFKKSSDKILILANEEDGNLLKHDSSKILSSLSHLLKQETDSNIYLCLFDVFWKFEGS